MDIFSIFFNMKVYRVFSSESLNQCGSNGFTLYHFQLKKRK